MIPLITIESLTRTYRVGDESVKALKSVDLDINSGEFAALSGPSGSGKSTLLNICGLLDTADSGQYFLQGKNVMGLSAKQCTKIRREQIGFIFQSFNLVPVMTAYENVEYPLFLTGASAAERKSRTLKILAQVGLSDYQHHLPDRLSGGQRQRVAIARALIKRPILVIADEPTANLDTTTANQIIDLMHHLAIEDGATFLVATHDDRMTRRCNRVIRLVDGKVAITKEEKKYEMA